MRESRDMIELDLNLDVTGIKYLKAELFWLEFEYLYGQFQQQEEEELEEAELPYVICNGNSGRNYANDVIDIKLNSHLIGETYKNIHVLKLSRNGIYHSLPEVLFHSLTLGSTFATVDDIKAAIKYNRQKTDEAYRFFAVFDNELFLMKTALFKRQLEWPRGDKRFITKLVREFLMLGRDHSRKQATLLLHTLSKHQELKNDYEALGQLLSMLLEKEVKVRAKRHQFSELPYATLGEGLLGLTLGLTGTCYAELDDVLIEVWLNDEQDENLHIKTVKEKKYIHDVMELFKIASSAIYIQYRVKKEHAGVMLGSNGYLGLNTMV